MSIDPEEWAEGEGTTCCGRWCWSVIDDDDNDDDGAAAAAALPVVITVVGIISGNMVVTELKGECCETNESCRDDVVVLGNTPLPLLAASGGRLSRWKEAGACVVEEDDACDISLGLCSAAGTNDTLCEAVRWCCGCCWYGASAGAVVVVVVVMKVPLGIVLPQH